MASRCTAPGGVNADPTAADAGLPDADPRPIAVVKAVKANALNTPRLPVTIFTAVISGLQLSGRWAIGVLEAIKSFDSQLTVPAAPKIAWRHASEPAICPCE